MQRIIFATGNEGKMKEIRMLLKDLDYQVISMKEAGIDIDIIEDGDTFEANAIIKAKAIMEMTGEIVLADDSGLEVDAMDKGPGVYSARFMGEDTSYDIKNNYILDRLKGLKGSDRSARFVCVIACAFPDGRILTTRGVFEGLIGDTISGENGFGYDPIFWVPEYGCTSADLSPEVKNEVSHRGKALKEMKDKLKEWM
ncbi:XTP/dITP diphosphatase [Anaerocolumna sp. AGMB13020]|uniref:XTP/dITP diphosphatase n=1 Tax=Anaerocolumna sp. AGMB13020 TaxID=3081750 RepID=UPI0029550136|nr:XTP/dITP diphosphatase [Anaerocolumna sp. AGMB13020]WOO39178.1 XTP/dITP diphosphatase [Anaerocolumna sp. AGMB13020]